MGTAGNKAKPIYFFTLGSSLLPLFLSAVGLILIFRFHLYAGHREEFSIAFAVVFLVSLAEVAIAFSMWIFLRCRPNDLRASSISLVAAGIAVCTSVIGLVLAVYPLDLVSEKSEETKETDGEGCLKGLGCSNLFALLIAVFYALRTICIILGFLIAMWLQVLDVGDEDTGQKIVPEHSPPNYTNLQTDSK